MSCEHGKGKLRIECGVTDHYEITIFPFNKPGSYGTEDHNPDARVCMNETGLRKLRDAISKMLNPPSEVDIEFEDHNYKVSYHNE